MRPSQAPTLPRLALLAAVVVQLADGLTFAAGLRLGVPLEAEANPLARLVFVDFGVLGVISLKLAAVALVILLVGLAQHGTPNVAAGRRRVLVGSAVIGVAGVIGTAANLWALLPVLGVS